MSAEYEPTVPSLRNDVRGYWAVAFPDFEAAVRHWALLYAAFGAEPDQAVEYAFKWATDHGYLPEGYAPMTFDRNRFAEIKAMNRIEDVAARLTELRGTGNTRRGRCPLHKGNNPGAFVVWPETQRFRCFNCGETGDVIDLMQKAGIRVG